MPRVNAVNPQVRSVGLPAVRQTSVVNAENFGAGEARALQQLGATGANIAQMAGRFVAQENTRQAKEAYQNGADELRSFSLGLRQTKGDNARGITQQMDDEIQRIYDAQTKDMADGARRQFDVFWNGYVGPQRDVIDIHELDQTRKADVARNTAIIDGSVQDAVASPKNIMVYAKAIQDANASLVSIARAQQWTPEELEKQREGMLHQIHTKSIERMIAEDDIDGARKRFLASKDQIDSRMHGQIQAKLDRRSDVLLAHETATKYVALADDDTLTDGDIVDAARDVAARENKSPEFEAALVRNIKTRLNEKRAAKQQRHKQVFDGAVADMLEASPVEAMAIAEKAEVDPTYRLRLINMAESMTAAQAGPQSDKALRLAMEEVDNAKREGRELTAEEAEGLVYENGGTRANAKTAANYAQKGGLEGGVTLSKVKSVARNLGVELTDEKLITMTRQVVDDLQRTAPGKPITDEALRTRIAAWSAEGEETTPGDFVWDDMTALQAVQKGYFNVWLPDVGGDERDLLRTEMRANGVKPGDINDKAIRLYKKDVKLGLPLTKEEIKRAAWRKAPRKAVSDKALKSGSNKVQSDAPDNRSQAVKDFDSLVGGS